MRKLSTLDIKNTSKNLKKFKNLIVMCKKQEVKMGKSILRVHKKSLNKLREVKVLPYGCNFKKYKKGKSERKMKILHHLQ